MKKLLIGCSIIIVLFLAAVAVAPFFIPIPDRADLVARIKAATGRDATIAGDISIAVFPHIGLDIDDVTLANPPGTPTPDMMRVARLEVRVKLLPLLFGRVRVNRFVLRHPAIALEIAADGRPNWVFDTTPAAALASTGATEPAPPQAMAPGDTLDGLTIRNLRLIDGTVSYLNRRTGAHQAVADLDMDMALKGPDRTLIARGAAVWHDEKVALTLTAATPGAVLKGGRSAIALSLTSDPVTLAFTGAIDGRVPVDINGTVNLKARSLRDVAAWTGTTLAMQQASAVPLAVTGALDISGATARFANAALTLGQSHATGQIAITVGGARPLLQGSLIIDRLDLNPYLPPERAGPDIAAEVEAETGFFAHTAEDAGGWSTRPIDTAGLKAVDIDLAVTTGGLTYRRLVFGSAALDLTLHAGTLTARLAHFAAYQGNGQAMVMLDGSGAVPAMRAVCHLNEMTMEPLLRDIAGFEKLSGIGTIDLDLTATGRSQRDMMGTLAGTGAITLSHARFRGFNLIEMVRTLAATVLPIGRGDTAVTLISGATASVTVNHGILRNNDLVLHTDSLSATGAGTADLAARTLDYRLTPKPIAGILTVPVAISGPWSDLRYRPDLTGITHLPAKIRKRASGPLHFLKRLFGGD